MGVSTASNLEKEVESQEEKELLELIETDTESELRALIFQSEDRQELLVTVPEWRCKILMRAMSGDQRADFLAFQRSLQAGSKDFFKKSYFRVILLSALHPKTKKPIFKSTDQDTLLLDKNGAVLETLALIGQELSHLDGSTAEAARKNFVSTPRRSATTSSQSDSGTSMSGTYSEINHQQSSPISSPT